MANNTLKLSEFEEKFLSSLHFLTGREDRQEKLDDAHVNTLKAIIPAAQATDLDKDAACDLMNRILLTLAIRPMTREFFSIVFDNVMLDNIIQVEKAVHRFRVLCMLEHGNFRFGYKYFNKFTVSLRDSWDMHFPDINEEKRRVSALKKRPKPAGLTSVPQDRLFALGYIASESSPGISSARKTLKPILDDALVKRIDTWKQLTSAAKKHDVTNLGLLLQQAALPETDVIIGGELYLRRANKTFKQALASIADSCLPLDSNDIQSARDVGIHNTAAYLAMHDLDVYVATSMRTPIHFTSNNAFVTSLFHKGPIADLNIRYFDPTQSYVDDRIQKGLLECLMIKRARLTVYNAQEDDTFGKDSELGVTLAQRKPAIVYVSRFFHDDARFFELYSLIDSAPRLEKKELIENAIIKSYCQEADRDKLMAPERTKADAVRTIIESGLSKIIEGLRDEEIIAELIHHGYSTASANSDPKDLCVKACGRLERRATTFREIHPLSLQTSPIDGVARGIYVSRSVEQTAALVKGLLIGKVDYDIHETEYNWLLKEKTSGAPVRVVTKNRFLTAAFWSEKWGSKNIDDIN